MCKHLDHRTNYYRSIREIPLISQEMRGISYVLRSSPERPHLSARAPADSYHRIKYLERGFIPDLGQLDGTVPSDMNSHVFTLRVQGKSYREIARETGMSKSSVGRLLGAFKQTK